MAVLVPFFVPSDASRRSNSSSPPPKEAHFARHDVVEPTDALAAVHVLSARTGLPHLFSCGPLQSVGNICILIGRTHPTPHRSRRIFGKRGRRLYWGSIFSNLSILGKLTLVE